jgi:GxxExxY protein
MQVNEITDAVIGAAIEVHKVLGPGLLESAYVQCLCYELTLRKLPFALEVPLPVIYKGLKLDCGYRMDMVVADRVVVEVKAVERLAPINEAQLLTYLRLSGRQVALLINFNVPVLKQGLCDAYLDSHSKRTARTRRSFAPAAHCVTCCRTAEMAKLQATD